MNSAPIFIVGIGRSGSTLLRMILASHSRIAVLPETWYLIPLVEELPIDRPLALNEVDRAARIMTGHYRWPDMGIEESVFRRRLADLRDPLLRDVVGIVCQNYMQREGKARWGDKTPPYIKIVPQLAAVFPNARFIHLFRDGRDVANSIQLLGWFGPWLHEKARRWNESIDMDERWNRTALASRILQLRYEDLVLETEKSIREVCRFLDEDYEPEMLAWHGHLDRLLPSREASIHPKLKRKPEPSDIYRWKQELRPREVFVLEAFMGKRLERRGYERRYRSAMWQPVFFLVRWYCRLVLPLAGFQMRVFRFVHKRLNQFLVPGAAR